MKEEFVLDGIEGKLLAITDSISYILSRRDYR